MHIETIAVHAGHLIDPATAAVTPPIHLSTTFAREADGTYRAGFLYSRYANPNRTSLEQCLPELDGVAASTSTRSLTSPIAAAACATWPTRGPNPPYSVRWTWGPTS